MLRIEDQHADSLPIPTGTVRGWQFSRCSQLHTVTACEDCTRNHTAETECANTKEGPLHIQDSTGVNEYKTACEMGFAWRGSLPQNCVDGTSRQMLAAYTYGTRVLGNKPQRRALTARTRGKILYMPGAALTTAATYSPAFPVAAAEICKRTHS
jgi:hypothetical protein